MRRLLKLVSRIGGLLVLAVAGVIGTSAAVLAAVDPPRGRLIDIGEGRRLRLVCEGPAAPAAPVVWFEAGAWGIAADWAAVQAKLTTDGVRSCAYDRAGLGYSDKGPGVRDAEAIAQDLSRLVDASGERGPFVVVAHSAGGLYLRAFTGLRPELIRGVVLVDAMTPEAVRDRMAQGFLGRFRRTSRWTAAAATIGLLKPVALTSMADRIGLPDQARPEKRRALGSGKHHRAAAAEVQAWPQSVEFAGAQPPFRREWPVAVVTARRNGPAGANFDQLRAAPAREARRGTIDVVDGAGHLTLLGETYGGRVVEAIRFVSAPG